MKVKKIGTQVAKDSSSQSFYFLIFIFLIYIFSFFRAKKKREKEQEEMEQKKRSAPPPKAQKKPALSHMTISEIKTVKHGPQRKETKNPYSIYKKNKNEPRIKKLVKSLPSKRDMIAISEILKPYEPPQ